MPRITFQQIPNELAYRLLAFASKTRMGRTIEIDGKAYKLDHISQNSSQFYKSRGMSVYFRVDRSVIRISDHWCASNHHPRSRKLNCGSISGQFWAIDNGTADTLSWMPYAKQYPWVMLAGRAGLSVLNQTCDHWIEGGSK
jgi:hypothetical protein